MGKGRYEWKHIVCQSGKLTISLNELETKTNWEIFDVCYTGDGEFAIILRRPRPKDEGNNDKKERPLCGKNR